MVLQKRVHADEFPDVTSRENKRRKVSQIEVKLQAQKELIQSFKQQCESKIEALALMSDSIEQKTRG